jgi:hypothetical protein
VPRELLSNASVDARFEMPWPRNPPIGETAFFPHLYSHNADDELWVGDESD